MNTQVSGQIELKAEVIRESDALTLANDIQLRASLIARRNEIVKKNGSVSYATLASEGGTKTPLFDITQEEVIKILDDRITKLDALLNKHGITICPDPVPTKAVPPSKPFNPDDPAGLVAPSTY